MADIGRPTPQANLNLPTVGDFLYTFTVTAGDPLPADAELFLLIGKPPTPAVRWDFTITDGGTKCSIKIESDEVATIAANTTYWLVFLKDPTDPDTRLELQTGKVKKVNAK